MKKRKKREYLSSELVQQFIKIYHLEDKMEVLKIRDFLEEYLDQQLYSEITEVALRDKVLTLKINSPLLRNDFKMRKSFYFQKFKIILGEEKLNDLQIL
ncbi:DciA family protein [Elizabethkingia sp. JS20170427COW]|uniref:DciA family protein n=1 Tax=Elizabethkingia sp. JS20170427COW TaxID=2583851 RepID=UPI0011104F5F|nr:DciA family protein [Elizabethkingia sp. JS20170427COW]QCX53840.1 DUF721 domain-containing protein [Elizabethkingia sp. JS20170427COW]